MASIRPVTVGPIVGWTTEDSVRLWGRGDSEKSEDGGPVWCHGLARLHKKGASKFGAPQHFKLLAHFDFTGTTDFDGLEAASEYEYQLGYVLKEGDWDVPDAELDWSEASGGTFRTGPRSGAGGCSFVFGSCRYLLRIFGGSVFGMSLFDGRGDKTFRSILRQIDGDPDKGLPPRATDFLLMVGDQIYADDLRFVSPDRTAADYFERYQKVFSQEHIRTLMRRLPTYMILDDHEIQDNWSMDRLPRDGDLYAAAMQAYQSYQMVHGPAFDPAVGTPNKLWYTFNHGGADFFVLDTRTERFSSFTPPQIIGANQMRQLKAWLLGNPERVKFVVTSVLMFPDTRIRNGDAWAGFEAQRREILDFIRDNDIQHVVFLSGDVHCSMAAQLRCSTHPRFRVTSVVSSSLYWPYPQGRADSFSLSGPLLESGSSVYSLSSVTPVVSDDNFTRVTVDSGRLSAEFYERKGDLVGRHTFDL